MYRPKDWEEIAGQAQENIAKEWSHATGSTILEKAIEAGADAMLEALKAEGVHFIKAAPDNHREVISFLDAVDTGTLCFIKDEET